MGALSGGHGGPYVDPYRAPGDKNSGLSQRLDISPGCPKSDSLFAGVLCNHRTRVWSAIYIDMNCAERMTGQMQAQALDRSATREMLRLARDEVEGQGSFLCDNWGRVAVAPGALADEKSLQFVFRKRANR